MVNIECFIAYPRCTLGTGALMYTPPLVSTFNHRDANEAYVPIDTHTRWIHELFCWCFLFFHSQAGYDGSQSPVTKRTEYGIAHRVGVGGMIPPRPN